MPTLDELLGTEGGASEGGEAVELPEETGETELDRLLSGQEIVDEFRSAVDLMNRSAERLGAARDTGLTTQRMQEDVLRALDKLIADAQQRGQQSSSSSSSSSQQQQGQQQQQPGQQSSPQASQGDNRGEANAPGGQDGALRAGAGRGPGGVGQPAGRGSARRWCRGRAIGSARRTVG
ncbi:MAG: hypothetical protein HND58_05625 [Planctomycetota bacterium]|nr:MAG: hypothetical protein HND58_05625 [Planctomycetota bacterium]